MRFNTQTKHKEGNYDLTRNHAGAVAFALSPEMELYTAVVTTMLADTYYETGDARLQRICELVAKTNAVFVAKLAVYAREQMYLRSAPLVLVAELAKIHNGDDLVGRTIGRIVQRADEITELLAYYAQANNRTGTKKLNRLSKQVQKGLALAFNRFDEYQFAKYDRAGAVTLRDALFLVHPTAKDQAQQAIFDRITSQTLTTPYTWETKLSALGQTQFASDAEKQMAVRQKWQELIVSGKLGYMATLRNLRNMLEANIDMAHLKQVCQLLANEQAVQKAKQMPFRFLATYREMKLIADQHIRAMPLVIDALEKAVWASAASLRGLDAHTRVVIACDVSGSMQTPISARSSVKNYDIGLLLAMLLKSRSQNVVTGMFGDTWKIVDVGMRDVLASVDEFYKREGEVGYSTNGYLVLDDLIRRKHRADKVMLFTDCQLWDSYTNNASNQNTLNYKWMQYKKLFPKAKLYVFDLSGYGHSLAPLRKEANGVYLIAGWSDKVFDVLHAMEKGQTALAMITEIVL